MLTVLIAENDSGQLERLLQLVNWGIYGYEAIACEGDAAVALEAIFRTGPELVLLGGDLPGMDPACLISAALEHGISCDFVIINERGSFDTAKAAMSLGVEEYLARPVSRDELSRVLKKYAERRRAAETGEPSARTLNTARLLRNSFMDRFTALNAPEYYTLSYMNRKFDLNFREGVFQTALVLAKGIPGDEDGDFFETVIEDARARFDPVCYEMVPYVQGRCRVSFTFNYEPGGPADGLLPELFVMVRDKISKCGGENTIFSVGIGLPETDSLKLRRTLETAERALRCALLRGQNKLYSYGKLEFEKLTSLDILTPTLLGDLKSSSEALDISGFERAVRSAFSPVSVRSDPAILIDICWAAIEAVAGVFRAEDGMGRLPERREILDRLGSETTLSDTITDLVNWARGLFARRLGDREYMRPVREAMRYIEGHCTQPLTLERVAEVVHLNASYFSTIFKKETGQNFSEYLISCRINEAKRLLRGSGLKITQICSAVGYTDNKHFSQVFKKTVGIKPSAYRALHG